MKDQSEAFLERDGLKRLIQGIQNEFIVIEPGQGISDDGLVIEVFDGTDVELSSFGKEIADIDRPFLIGSGCAKIPLKKIGDLMMGNLRIFLFLLPDDGLNPVQSHVSVYGRVGQN